MPKDETNPLNIIEEANARTLDYFNKTYVDNLELVQSLKTELFELEVQIETLEKTRELYSYPRTAAMCFPLLPEKMTAAAPEGSSWNYRLRI